MNKHFFFFFWHFCTPVLMNMSDITFQVISLKQLSGMTSILVLNFVMHPTDVLHPTDHDFIFFRVFRFLQIFFIYIYMNPTVTQTNFLYTWTPAKGRLNVPTALGHMLMPSAQRWADIRCCRGTPLINPFPQQLRAAAIDVTMWLLWSCRLRWSVFAAYIVVCCKQTCLHDSICLGNRACFVFFSASTLFSLHFCICRLYSFI